MNEKLNEPSKLTQLMLYLEGYFFDDKPTLLSVLMDDAQMEVDGLREALQEHAEYDMNGRPINWAAQALEGATDEKVPD